MNIGCSAANFFRMFLEWPVIFLSEHSQDDQDKGVGGPFLQTPNEDPGSKW